MVCQSRAPFLGTGGMNRVCGKSRTCRATKDEVANRNAGGKAYFDFRNACTRAAVCSRGFHGEKESQYSRPTRFARDTGLCVDGTAQTLNKAPPNEYARI